jgi:hypothetical protein
MWAPPHKPPNHNSNPNIQPKPQTKLLDQLLVQSFPKERSPRIKPIPSLRGRRIYAVPPGHKSFAVFGPLALLGNAFYPVPVHRPAASFPRSVALMQLRFASLTLTSL